MATQHHINRKPTRVHIRRNVLHQIHDILQMSINEKVANNELPDTAMVKANALAIQELARIKEAATNG